ncbi:MAG: histidine kinase, partial [Bacteroidota bacterium]
FHSKVAETELKALRSQMNPHFIFNALNSISDYMAKNNVDIANTYLLKFAKLTRSILESSEKKWINLSEDLELMELYIQIEALRLKNKLSYTITVAQEIDAENTLVPPMLLQPFIENSIWHGIAAKEGKGHIAIGIRKEGDMVVCSVDDNGVGRKKTLNVKTDYTSMGVKITESRLDIIGQLKKVKGSIAMFDKKEGLLVELKLPLELRF